MARQWTDEDRAVAAERCRRVQPWKHSTGPKTIAGKRKAAGNAPRRPTGWGLDEALLEEAYRRWYDHDDGDGYRELSHQARLARRRLWHSFKDRPPIKAWKPPGA
jgi:hypothetical protein